MAAARVTGPVYAKMADAGRDLVRSVGVSGVNVVRDGQEVRAHNPHTTLVYSMTLYDARLQDAMKQEADKFNAILPDGIQTTFKDVSIVEIGFAGNVLREIYRISLEDGSAIDVATGKPVKRWGASNAQYCHFVAVLRDSTHRLSMSRAERLLDLLQTLRRHRLPVSGHRLASELGISLRTLYRDIATLQAQGAEIDGEPGMGYVLKPGFMLPPLMFSTEEIEALVLGTRWVAQRSDARLA